MADGSQVAERYVVESTPGTTPVDSTAWKVFPISGSGGLSAQPVTSASNRVRSDRGKTAPSVVGYDINGGYSAFDFKADQVDDFFESALSNTFNTGVLVNGNTLKTMTIERQFNDLTDKYLKYRGAAVNTLNLQFANIRDRVTLTPTFIAMTHDNDDTTSSVGSGSVLAETTNRALTVLDLSNLTLSGTTGFCVESGSIQINNNLTAKLCAGSINAIDLIQGLFEVNGSLTLHTTDSSWQLLADRDGAVQVDLSFDLSDGTTTYSFDIPTVTVTLPDPTGVTANESVMLNVTIDASQADGSYTLQITKS